MRCFIPFILISLVLLSCGEKPPQSDQQLASARLDKEAPVAPVESKSLANTPSRAETTDEVTTSAPPTTLRVSNQLATNNEASPQDPPKGMIYVPGGALDMGSDRGLQRERPVHKLDVKGFYMDIHPVTVGQFEEFVESTGYKTQAEIFGDAAVFDLSSRQWYLQVGASWKYPRGRSAGAASPDHPVTQISWNDAQAYCTWAGSRLPTEAEWEHAARNGSNTRTQYSWGESLRDGSGRYLANTWQGTFPAHNSEADGYLYTCPVGTFGANELGLTDMSGNVWEWCQDWYKSYDPAKPGLVQTAEPERVMRGGSFMCDPGYCHGYRVSGRSGSTPETGLFHVGFRTVRDL